MTTVQFFPGFEHYFYIIPYSISVRLRSNNQPNAILGTTLG